MSSNTEAQDSSKGAGTTSSADKKPQSAATTSKAPSSSKTSTTSSAAQKTPDKIIIGKWRGSVDMAPMLREEGMVVEGEQLVSCDIEFTSNGVIYEKINRDNLKTVYKNVYEKALNDTLLENGLTEQEFELSIGMTYDEYLAELVNTTIELIPKTIISSYKFNGNDLYIRDSEDDDFEKEEYRFNGENKLIFVDDGVSITYTRIS